jgi:hypothetical protein
MMRLADIGMASVLLAFGGYLIYVGLCAFGALPMPAWLN